MVVVVDVVGAIGIRVVDCSVVVVLVTLFESAQPATKAVLATSATPTKNLRLEIMSVMDDSVLEVFGKTA